MTIYPAIDLRGGKCVRLTQGRADQETVYFEDPLDPARAFVAAGAAWIHMVDLDGAFEGAPRNHEIVRRVAELGARVQLGGGLRDAEAVRRVLRLGVSRAVIGTRAAENEPFVGELVREFGAEKIAVGIDAKDGAVAVRGWVETTALPALDFARRMAAQGVRTFIYTDISTDGMLAGPNLAAQEALLKAVPGCGVIASGGVSRLDDLRALAELGKRHPHLDGVIVGRAIYEKRLDVAEALRLAAG